MTLTLLIIKYLLNCQIMMSLSSLADAKYRPSFDHRTQFTQAASSHDLYKQCMLCHSQNTTNNQQYFSYRIIIILY